MPPKGWSQPFCKNGHARTPDNLYKNKTCKICNKMLTKSWRDKNLELAAAIAKRWRVNNPEVYGACLRKSRYRLREEQFQKLVSCDCCKICKKQFSTIVRPHIDHDHKCCVKGCAQCIRGLLCRECNLGIGYFKDNQESLLSAVNYLQNSSNYLIKSLEED